MSFDNIIELNEAMEESDDVVNVEVVNEPSKDIVVGSEKDVIRGVAPEIVKQLTEEKYRQISLWIKSNNYGLKSLERLNEVAIRKIFYKLMRGKSETTAIKGFCTWSTWCKLKDSDPEVRSIVEAAINYRKEKLSEEMLKIADQPDRTRVGEVARDKLMIDVRDREISRLDGVSSRLEKDKNGTPIVPIQFNLNFVGTNKKA